jgi:gamma-glutamyltranspeptidase/glutathione hydrolase
VSFDGGDAREPRTALVPGFVAGLLEWQAARGKLPRAAVLAPAIALARDGFVVGPLNHRLFAASADKLKADPEAAALFMPGGEVLAVGDRLVQPKLATLLEAIARDGAPAFYEGDFPRRVAEKTRRVGGLLDAADFAAYRPALRRPVCSAFGPYTVLGAPSPVAGASIAELLNLAERTGLTRGGDPTRDRRGGGAGGRAARERGRPAAGGGHPEWAPTPVRGWRAPEFAADARGAGGRGGARLGRARRRVGARGRGGAGAVRVARSVSGDAAPADASRPAASRGGAPRRRHPRPTPTESEGSQTSHLVVIDAERNAVSLTSSVGVLFGSGVYAEGVWLNSSGNLFARGERAPRRKPGSALTPTLLVDGVRVRRASGRAGRRTSRRRWGRCCTPSGVA